MIYQRINKILFNNAISLIRKSELLFRDNKVTVIRIITSFEIKVYSKKDNILNDGKIIKNFKIRLQLLLFNKPKLIITAFLNNFVRKIILDLFPNKNKTVFFTIGRLYYQGGEILLLTNDGTIFYKLSYPKFANTKAYLVKLNKQIGQSMIDFLRSGVNLDVRETLKCVLEIILLNSCNTFLKIFMKDGSNLQIRRIFFYQVFKVLDLKRILFVNFALENLKEADWTVKNRLKI